MEAAAYAPKPKGERARILELEARLSHLVTGGGASTPSVYRVPLWLWARADTFRSSASPDRRIATRMCGAARSRHRASRVYSARARRRGGTM